MDRIVLTLFAEARGERTGVGRRRTWSPNGRRYGPVRDELTRPARKESDEVTPRDGVEEHTGWTNGGRS